MTTSDRPTTPQVYSLALLSSRPCTTAAKAVARETVLALSDKTLGGSDPDSVLRRFADLARSGHIAKGSILVVDHPGVFCDGPGAFVRLQHSLVGLLGAGVDISIDGQRFEADVGANEQPGQLLALFALSCEKMTGISAGKLLAQGLAQSDRRTA